MSEQALGNEMSFTLNIDAFRRASAVARNVIQLGEAVIALHELVVERWPEPLPGSREAVGRILFEGASPAKAAAAVSSISSSGRALLITRRSLSLPASGAKVSPVLL